MTHFIDRLRSSLMPAPTIASPPPIATSLSSPPPTPPLPPNHLQLTAAMAHQLGQYKAGFLARTSHELRSPLNRVMSLQQLILADLCDDPEEERDFTRKSYEAAEELLELLNQTTTISKLAHGTFPLKLEPLSLAELLSELLMQTQLHAKNRNLRLTIDFPEPDRDVEVVADRTCLRQVLLNIVTTPIYQMDEGFVKVTHQLNAIDQTVSIFVEDERPATAWSESIELATAISGETTGIPLAAVPPDATPAAGESSLPPSHWGLSMMVTTELVEAMQGKLSLLSSTATADAVTRIECTFPWIGDRPTDPLDE
ncbi:MAG: histidine kinase dimerization/phospho-acceptor domain-containing protein [Leptolyngbyaceae bacterium]|nr:histidine kinase dimerization/phospho-acceptor domain-containing protein [Leptolyngbyaceae bacterium]